MEKHPPKCTNMLSIKNSVIWQILSAVYMLSLPSFRLWMKYPFDLVTLMWVYLTLPSFFLKALCARLPFLDFNRLYVKNIWVVFGLFRFFSNSVSKLECKKSPVQVHIIPNFKSTESFKRNLGCIWVILIFSLTQISQMEFNPIRSGLFESV